MTKLPVLVCAFALLSAGQDTPEAPENPAAADSGVRMHAWLAKMFGPQALLETVPGAISDHVRNFPSDWGRGGSGFLKRTGSQYGQFVVSTAIEAGVQAIHKEDPRYFRLGQGSVMRRTGYALKSSFWVRKPGGGRTFAWSLPAGVYGSWAVATRWSPPDLQGPGKFFEWGSVGMSIKVGANVFREFWPDVRTRVFRRPAKTQSQLCVPGAGD